MTSEHCVVHGSARNCPIDGQAEVWRHRRHMNGLRGTEDTEMEFVAAVDMLLGRLWCRRRDTGSRFIVRLAKSAAMQFEDHRCLFSLVDYSANAFCFLPQKIAMPSKHRR